MIYKTKVDIIPILKKIQLYSASFEVYNVHCMYFDCEADEFLDIIIIIFLF